MSGSASEYISRRKLLQLGTGTAAAAALAGCTSPSSGGGTATAGGTLKLLVLGPTSDLVSYLNTKALPAFQAQTGTKVELQTSDWGSAFQKVITGAASNSLADVLNIGGIWTAALAEKNVLLDISSRLNAWADKSQFREASLLDSSYKGKNYAVPITMDIRTGVYRKDLVDSAGVSSLPTTWDDFRQAAQSVKAKGQVNPPIDWAVDKSIGLQQTFAQLFLQAGGRYWDDSGKASFNSEAGNRALTYLVDTYKLGLADVNQVYSGDGPRPLVAGSSALTLNGWLIQQNADSYNKSVSSAIVAGPPLRADPNSKPVSVAWINKLAIARNTKSPDAAWKLVTFLAGAAQLNELARLLGTLPARKDLASTSWMTPMAKQVMATADQAISQPVNPVMLQLGPAVQSLLEPAIRRTTSVSDTLKAIDDKVNSLHA